jgi:hypothetical protein
MSKKGRKSRDGNGGARVEDPVKPVYDDFVIGNVTFDGEVYQGEMEIRAEGGEATVHAWLNKEKAQKLVEHLTKVFGLG